MCIYKHIKILKNSFKNSDYQWRVYWRKLKESFMPFFFLQLKNSKILSDYRHGVLCYSWYLKNIYRASFMVQWLRICLPMQGTQAWSLVWEDSTCHRATKPVDWNHWARTPKVLYLRIENQNVGNEVRGSDNYFKWENWEKEEGPDGGSWEVGREGRGWLLSSTRVASLLFRG